MNGPVCDWKGSQIAAGGVRRSRPVIGGPDWCELVVDATCAPPAVRQTGASSVATHARPHMGMRQGYERKGEQSRLGRRGVRSTFQGGGGVPAVAVSTDPLPCRLEAGIDELAELRLGEALAELVAEEGVRRVVRRADEVLLGVVPD